jgi:hypothetical protein
VRDSDVAESVVAGEARRTEQHVEVQHVVNNHAEVSRVCCIPAARAANDGIKASRQRCGERLDRVNRGCILRVAGSRAL